MADTDAPRGYARGRERREAILKAANEVFAARGFRGASLATIAERVGLSEPGLLHHFRSKDELLLEVLKLREQHDYDRVEDAMGDTAPYLDALLDLARDNEANPGLTRLFAILGAEAVDADHPAHEWFRERYRTLRGFVTEHIEEAQERGEIAAGLDARVLATQVLAVWDGLQLQWLLDPDEVDLATAFEDYLAGLSAR
jgi:AcrR family transcriptional regulator